jgi:hypothetical protein
MPKYEFHEYANAFPLMEEAELDALAADIKKYGQRDAILLYDGKILDGRNRYLACLKAKVEPRVTIWGGDCDLIALVRSKNFFRRHTTAAQRAQIIVELNELMAHGGDRKSKQVATLQLESTQKKMAVEAQVSKRTVSDAVKIKRKGVPELVEAVKRGKVSGPAAAIAANMKPAKQRKLVERGSEAVNEAVRSVVAEAPFRGVGTIESLSRNWDAATTQVKNDFKQRYGLMEATNGLLTAYKASDIEARAELRVFIREELKGVVAPNGKTDQFGRPHAAPGSLLKR